MNKINFNKDWKVTGENDRFIAKEGSQYGEYEVSIPHDAMLNTERTKEAFNGSKKAYFSNGTWEYKKDLFAEKDWENKLVYLEFEGVFNRTKVYVNDAYVGKNDYGYSEFDFCLNSHLNFGEKNTIKVVASTGDDSRWYSGAGIYRNVNLLVGEKIHISNNGVEIYTTNATKEKAEVIVTSYIENNSNICKVVKLKNEILDSELSEELNVTIKANDKAKVRQRFLVNNPKLWDIDTPKLYNLKTTIVCDDKNLDEVTNAFGIRSLSLDTTNGLMVNGTTVKLRGACIHHDNGILGAKTYKNVEFRKIKKLKEAGFNAVRIAHHPAGRYVLEACDELGMFVMDETFDMWNVRKSQNDYSQDFETSWEKDVTAMVKKDFNHPSVIMYSIGNEINDLETDLGKSKSREISEKIRSLDNTRYTTICVNGVLTLGSKLGSILASTEKKEEAENAKDINEQMASVSDLMNDLVNLPILDESVNEAFTGVDVAGYNYMTGRYATDKIKYPNRVIVGSETFATNIDEIWKDVMENNNVIGDFTWTGWDYLGEAGLGKVKYENHNEMEMTFYGDYPWITAWCGDIDITGYRLPQSYYREIVFGFRKNPYIVVTRPEFYGKKPKLSPWSFDDVISSWSFNDDVTRAEVTVYSHCEEVEIFVNGTSKGKEKTNRFKAKFDLAYEVGEIEAVAYTNGEVTGRFKLNSAIGKEKVKVTAENEKISLGNEEIAFVNIELVDDNGNLFVEKDCKLTVEVKDAGELLGFGSGNPCTAESYLDNEHTTFEGRAFINVMPKKVGEIEIIVKAEHLESQTIKIIVEN